MLGSANITGSKLFHILSGNLSHQIEHHLFPDMPARRYPEIAPEVKALCEKYGLPYNTGRFSKQIGSTWGKIFRLAVPSTRGTKPAQTPGYGGAAGSGRRVTESGRMVGNIEIGKDTVQVLAESAASHVGRIATILTGAVRDVTREIGEWATDVFEMREAAERAREAGSPDLYPLTSAGQPVPGAGVSCGRAAGSSLDVDWRRACSARPAVDRP